MKKFFIGVLMSLCVKSFAPPPQFDLNFDQVIEEMGFNERLKRERPDLFVLAMRESASWKDTVPNWAIVNSLGCVGAFQIKHKYLKKLGFDFMLDSFVRDPNIFPPDSQVKAICKMMDRNREIIRPYFDYVGDTIRGIGITETGIMYAAHIAGAGGVKRFFDRGHNPRDINGTSLMDYLDFKRTFKRKNIDDLFVKLN